SDNDYSGRLVKVRRARAAGKAEVDLQNYWSTELVNRSLDGAGESENAAARRLASGYTATRIEEVSSGSPRDWGLETLNVARSVAYDFSGITRISEERHARVVSLSPGYDERATAVVREQLAKAGFRLARLLNEAFVASPRDGRS